MISNIYGLLFIGSHTIISNLWLPVVWRWWGPCGGLNPFADWRKPTPFRCEKMIPLMVLAAKKQRTRHKFGAKTNVCIWIGMNSLFLRGTLLPSCVLVEVDKGMLKREREATSWTFSQLWSYSIYFSMVTTLAGLWCGPTFLSEKHHSWSSPGWAQGMIRPWN